MAKYNINVRTASHIADTLSVNKNKIKDLRVELSRFVGELLRDHAELIWEDTKWQVDVTDASGKIIYVVDVSASQSLDN